MIGRPWIVHRGASAGARVRLFCLPYAGGGASTYRTWSEELPAPIDVCPVELPGRETRFSERAYARMEVLVADLAEMLAPAVRDVPFALFGHSMGALVSFELARRLHERHGATAVHLFVSAHRAPQLPDPDPPLASLSHVDLLRRLRELGGTPRAVLENPEVLEIVLPILRADAALLEAYAYASGPALPVPITAFGGLSDRHVPRAELADWATQTSAAFALRMLPGDHFFLHQSPRRTVLEEIARALLMGSDPSVRGM